MNAHSNNKMPYKHNYFCESLDLDNENKDPVSRKGDTGDRVIILCEPITPQFSIRVIAQLLSYDAAKPGVPIHMQIFSQGGCVVSGLAIIDTMKHLISPVYTYSIGYAASMAAVILACGEKNHRYILPHSRVMIHQASGAAGGTLENVRATLRYHSELESDCDRILAEACSRKIDEIKNASRVDNWMSADESLKFGLVDHVIAPFAGKHM